MSVSVQLFSLSQTNFVSIFEFSLMWRHYFSILKWAFIDPAYPQSNNVSLWPSCNKRHKDSNSMLSALLNTSNTNINIQIKIQWGNQLQGCHKTNLPLNNHWRQNCKNSDKQVPTSNDMQVPPRILKPMPPFPKCWSLISRIPSLKWIDK